MPTSPPSVVTNWCGGPTTTAGSSDGHGRDRHAELSQEPPDQLVTARGNDDLGRGPGAPCRGPPTQGDRTRRRTPITDRSADRPACTHRSAQRLEPAGRGVLEGEPRTQSNVRGRTLGPPHVDHRHPVAALGGG